MSTVVAAAGTVFHCMARVVADGMRCVAMYAAAAASAAAAAATGAIAHGMARMV